MDIEQLKIVLSMVQTVTDGAMYVLFAWLALQVLQMCAVLAGIWLVCRVVVQWVRVAWHEDDWLMFRKRLFPHRRGSYESDEHRDVVRALNALIDSVRDRE